jgi:hypothetical protein
MRAVLERLRRRTLVLTENRRRQRFNCHQQDDANWQRRAEAAVAMWTEHGDTSASPLRVGDFGAGSERLRPVLADGLTQPFHYLPYDLHPQRPTTRPLDLEREIPTEELDVAFILGVLEYLPSLTALPTRLVSCCRYLAVSYVPLDWVTPLSVPARRNIGWRSHLSRSQLGESFRTAGFALVAERETDVERVPLWLWKREKAGDHLASRRSPS